MTSARRVIIASRLYEPEAGAAAYRLAAVARALDDAGYQTTVLTSRPPSGERGTATVRRWPVLRDRSGAVRGYLPFASFDIPLFFRLLFARKPQVVVVEPPPTTGFVCRVVCGLRGIPYVYFSADVASSAARGIGVNALVVALLVRLERWVLRGAARVLAVSDGVRDEVVELGADPERVTVVGTGVDTELFSRDGVVADSDHPYLVYAGTMSEIHGAAVFVEAFSMIAARHPTARLAMFGQGVEREALEALAERLLPGRITFAGLLGGEEVARWMRGATAGLASVRPGRGYDFAYATKAFVTLSCGAPVIYSGVGPVGPLVERDDLGWAVAWDAASVAAAMDAALSSPPSRARRDALSQWTERNASLHEVGRRAVAAIDRVNGIRP